MVFGKLTDFGCFPLDAMPMCATPSSRPLNICGCVRKFTDVVCSFYCASYELTFVSILVLWLLIIAAIISDQDPYGKTNNRVRTMPFGYVCHRQRHWRQ